MCTYGKFTFCLLEMQPKQIRSSSEAVFKMVQSVFFCCTHIKVFPINLSMYTTFIAYPYTYSTQYFQSKLYVLSKISQKFYKFFNCIPMICSLTHTHKTACIHMRMIETERTKMKC